MPVGASRSAGVIHARPRLRIGRFRCPGGHQRASCSPEALALPPRPDPTDQQAHRQGRQSRSGWLGAGARWERAIMRPSRLMPRRASIGRMDGRPLCSPTAHPIAMPRRASPGTLPDGHCPGGPFPTGTARGTRSRPASRGEAPAWPGWRRGASAPDARTRGADIGRRAVGVGPEVPHEHGGQLGRLAVVRLLVGPGGARLEE